QRQTHPTRHGGHHPLAGNHGVLYAGGCLDSRLAGSAGAVKEAVSQQLSAIERPRAIQRSTDRYNAGDRSLTVAARTRSVAGLLVVCGKQNNEYPATVGQPILAAAGFQRLL